MVEEEQLRGGEGRERKGREKERRGEERNRSLAICVVSNAQTFPSSPSLPTTPLPLQTGVGVAPRPIMPLSSDHCPAAAWEYGYCGQPT